MSAPLKNERWAASTMVMDAKAWGELNAGHELTIVRANWDGFTGEVVAVVWDDDDARERQIAEVFAATPRLISLLADIAKEAKIANDVIRLGRDGKGNGRVKVATAMHHIARMANEALDRAGVKP